MTKKEAILLAGTKLFAVSGSVMRPGVYEVPFGVPLRHLIYDLAGGLGMDRELQAILTGGAAGTCSLTGTTITTWGWAGGGAEDRGCCSEFAFAREQGSE